MKLHIGADSKSGLVHSASGTAANVHDSHQVPNLLHGEETCFYGDSACRGNDRRARLKQIAPNAKEFPNKCAYKTKVRYRGLANKENRAIDTLAISISENGAGPLTGEVRPA